MSNSNLSEEEINELNQSIKIIVGEYSSKKESMEQLKPIIIELKTEYNNKIKSYQLITKKIISLENSLEIIENKIVKIEKKQKTLLLNLTKDCYHHLIDISENINNKFKYETLSNFLKLLTVQIYNDPNEGILIFKNEYELKNLLQYLNEVYSNFDKYNIQKYKDYFLFYQQNSKKNYEYPFDFLFEFLGTIFDKIELQNSLLKKKYEIEKEIENKNILFLELKKLETEIRQNDSLYRSLGMYRKYIHKILEKYKESKENSDFDSLKQILLTIEKTKNFDVNQVNNFDNMSSLSMKSEYSFSENSSINNLSVSYIVLPSVNNGIVNLEEKEKKNEDKKIIKIKIEDVKINSNNLKKNKNNSKNIINNDKKDNSNNKSNQSTNKKLRAENDYQLSDKIDDEKIEKESSSYQNLITTENIENSSIKNTIIKKDDTIKEENNEIFKKINPEKLKSKNQRNLNKQHLSNANLNYLDKSNSKRQFPKIFRHMKGDEGTNSESMSLLLPNKNPKLIGINNKTLIKDSICDEMIVSNFGTRTIKPSRGDYINELNKKNNMINFYLNPELLKKREEYNTLIIEKPIEASNCCVSCT